MIGLLVRRLGWSLLVLAIVAATTFVIFFAVPGKPALRDVLVLTLAAEH